MIGEVDGGEGSVGDNDDDVNGDDDDDDSDDDDSDDAMDEEGAGTTSGSATKGKKKIEDKVPCAVAEGVHCSRGVLRREP